MSAVVALRRFASSDLGRTELLILLVPMSLVIISPYLFLGWASGRADHHPQLVLLSVGALGVCIYGIASVMFHLSREGDALRGVWLFFVVLQQWGACALIAFLMFLLRGHGRVGIEQGKMIHSGYQSQVYEHLPWYRRSAVMSKFAIVGVLFVPALLPVCVSVLTGPVYYNRRKEDGSLRQWGIANKCAALLLLCVQGYIYWSTLFA